MGVVLDDTTTALRVHEDPGFAAQSLAALLHGARLSPCGARASPSQREAPADPKNHLSTGSRSKVQNLTLAIDFCTKTTQLNIPF
ncbi:hypothetical protein OSB04_024285 [Centaurea solstitialis]|uniref:Uncharacterized protein n=1 Tax=Centaurea solstitialis TaxID=347529 RepID=A0AA38STB9_9ASTR|nr:hypothetical protein OSB04_024285 [Centaurea solstitialis]